ILRTQEIFRTQQNIAAQLGAISAKIKHGKARSYAQRYIFIVPPIDDDQRVSNLNYGLTTNLSGVPGIAVTGAPDIFGRNIIRPLIIVDGWDYKNVTLSVGARLTMFDLGRYGAELRSDVLLGSEYLLSSEYFRPLTHSRRWFVAPAFVSDNSPLNIYSADGLIAEYRNRTVGGRGDIGYQSERSIEVRFGYEAANQRLDRKS